MILKEARLHFFLHDHQHIVPLTGISFGLKNEIYFVMPDLSPSLLDFLKSTPNIPLSQKWTIAKEIATGMAALHSMKILHHDLRASNVLLGPPPRRCQITDFGLSKEETSYMKSSMSGNPMWLAPEYAGGGKYTTACDVYSFGVLLYEVVSGGKTPLRVDSFLRCMMRRRGERVWFGLI